jgi:hypothetical protein
MSNNGETVMRNRLALLCAVSVMTAAGPGFAADKNRMLYQFTVEDPETWVTPWGGEYEFNRGDPVYEYACHEGNYALANILAGARSDEAIAAAKLASANTPLRP